VLDLALSLWPDSDASDFVVERLQGGGFHRIVGLTRRQPAVAVGETHYIVRIPRFDSAQVDDEVAVLYYLNRTAIPAPTVVTFNGTADNALGLPYMVQNQIAGTDLYSYFPTLDHGQKLRIARELGGIFLQMLEARSSTGGRVVLDGDTGAIRIAPLSLPQPPLTRPRDDNAPSVPPPQWLSALFLAKQADDPSETLWNEFGWMTRELVAGGWLSDMQYSLAHLDLAPRNILVDPTISSDPPRHLITGILDWDSAVLAPRFMSCYPPLWVWAWQDDEAEDERAANDDPGTAQGRELKALFEEAAGTDYVRFAYGASYRLARRLVRFAIDGVRSNEDYKEAQVMLQEWAEVFAPAGWAGSGESEEGYRPL
jgi:aminoglycoside phosphotransferase (APT) family kinase protein